VSIQGHSPNYSGNVEIDTSTVWIRHEDSLGTGRVTIRPAGTLMLAPIQGNFDNARLDLPNDVHLAGGELSGVSSVFRPQRLLGDLYVSGNSWIGTLEVVGDVHLADGSRLTTAEYHDTSLFGDILVGGTAEIHLGRDRIRSSALEANRAVVRLGGRIVSDARTSVLKIENAGLDDLVTVSSFHVNAGQSLKILHGGVAAPLEISGGSLSGAGTLLNSIVVGSGGSLSPGGSPGLLTVDGDASIRPGGSLAIELAGSERGTQYDALAVGDNVVLEGALLDVTLLGGFMPALDQRFDVLDFGSLNGVFSQLNLPALASGLKWDASELYMNGTLKIMAGLHGDFDQNGAVDAADYVVWRNSFGTTYTQNDYDLWRAHFGQEASSTLAMNVAVPEPFSQMMLLVGVAIMACCRRTACGAGSCRWSSQRRGGLSS
jgi:hypothetical protein